MQRFRSVKTLQKFSSVNAEVRNHFNQERHLLYKDSLIRTGMPVGASEGYGPPGLPEIPSVSRNQRVLVLERYPNGGNRPGDSTSSNLPNAQTNALPKVTMQLDRSLLSPRSLETETLGRSGRVARSHGLTTAGVWACCGHTKFTRR